MRKRARVVAVAAVILVVAAATAILTIRRQPVLDITTAEVTSGTVTRRIFATGTLQATRTVDVGTQVSGVVASLQADFNSIVHKGDVVARLDPSLLQAALDQARGALTQAEAAERQAVADRDTAHAAEEDARVKYARAAALANENLITQADLDAARISIDEAVAAVRSADGQIKEALAVIDQAKASVSQASINLQHTVITSPIDGIVLNRSVDIGQTVAAAVQAPVLFTLATDLTRLQLQVSVDQSEIGGVEAGQTVTFEVESFPDETFRGAISQVRLQPIAEQSTAATTIGSSTIGQQTTSMATVVSYATMIDVDNPDERLRPGMTASVVLGGLQHANVTRVPNAALSFHPSPDVFKALKETEPPMPKEAAADSNAKPRELWTYDGKTLIPRLAQYGLSDQQWTELATGNLHPGDRVVTSATYARR